MRKIVMASSRGKGLGAYLPEGTLVSVSDGATLGDLQEAAKEFLPPPSGLACGYRYHMYFLCGVPNITRLVKCSKEHYRECIYDEDPLVTAERYLAELGGCQKDMMAKGVLPVFCSITKVNLYHYNQSFINKKWTSSLKYQDQYPIMQGNLDRAIDLINSHITKTNKKIGVATPYLNQAIIERRGPTNARYYIYKWELMTDGLHPKKDKLCPKWGAIMSRAMAKNDLLEDSDDESSVRPWLPSKPSSASARPTAGSGVVKI